ncbi:inner centromere protein isoform X2 [Eucyclogobius newberryi]|uniref:inner centromere protein isoform X2 n=1 Tax=Eucyclogobius newberryi TaxID=166745 RepID=UPI003B5C4064
MAVPSNSVLSPVRSLMLMFEGKTQAFISEIDNVHMVWLEEIQQEANRMFTRDFNAEPELMPKTPSQKKNTRRKRVSLGRQEDSQARRRFSKGRRINLRGSSSSALNCITEVETVSQASTSKTENTRPKRAARKKQTKADEEEVSPTCHSSTKSEEAISVNTGVIEILDEDECEEQKGADVKEEKPASDTESPKNIPSPKIVVSISPADRLSAELAVKANASPGHTVAQMDVTEQTVSNTSRRSSVRHSLKLRHSVAGLKHSMTQESIRRASRRSMLKRKVSQMGNSKCDSNVGDDSCMDSVDEEAEAEETAEKTACKNETVLPPLVLLKRVTRSVAAHSPKLAPQPLFAVKMNTPDKRPVTMEKQTSQSSNRSSTKRKAPDVEESPTKRASPPKKSQSAIRPNMKSFLHTVQKNQMLMMTPTSHGRSSVLKSFIKHTTPLRMDQRTSCSIVTKERFKLEALKKKQEQEIERMKKMEEEKKKKQEELKKKRDERLKRVFEFKVKEEQREEEKKKKIEQKMAHIDEKNDKRVAEEKKKKMTIKRQEELDLKKKQEEEARKKKEEEKRQQELLANKKAEEERAQKMAEARRALELKREQERERELEKEREKQAAAERERLEREKALALQRELERAVREKERRELEEKRKALEEKRKLEQQLRLAAEEKAAKERQAAEKQRPVLSTPVGKGAGGNGLNVTVDIERSPQSYSITPKGGKRNPSKNPEDYGMDQNSDDSTDDESAPRKPIPSWAEGHNLQMLTKKQYFTPPNYDVFFGKIEPPNLENIFYKSKPRYFKRTSSAVWHSPPTGGK